MSRPRHNNKTLESILKAAEKQGWTITGGGNKHFKMRCPKPCKCMKTMSTSPSNPNYRRELVAQLGRVTCWEAK